MVLVSGVDVILLQHVIPQQQCGCVFEWECVRVPLPLYSTTCEVAASAHVQQQQDPKGPSASQQQQQGVVVVGQKCVVFELTVMLLFSGWCSLNSICVTLLSLNTPCICCGCQASSNISSSSRDNDGTLCAAYRMCPYGCEYVCVCCMLCA